MFFGSYPHSLDEKGRLVIPRKFREETGNKLFILKGFDGAMSLYIEEDFQSLIEKINSLPFNEKAARAYARVQLASVCELSIDKLGRVQIPSALLVKYNIGKDLIVIGAGDHIEVWNSIDYEEYEKQAINQFEIIAENLSKKED